MMMVLTFNEHHYCAITEQSILSDTLYTIIYIMCMLITQE